MTVKGSEKLKAELQTLKFEARPQVIAAIAEARAHGDLKELAESRAAQEQQGFIEGRIGEIEQTLGMAQIIDPSTLKANGKVVFGATVRLITLTSSEEVNYQIVGDLEADISQGLISISSPIARALIGKEEGDVAVVDAPSGEIEYEIVGVEYL